MKICLSCFKKYNNTESRCPYCGHEEILYPVEPIQLIPGTVLAKRYLLGEAIGTGGFGIVYKAWDTKLETIVAIKEFFVSRLSTRAEGTQMLIVSQKSKKEFNYRKERFLAEARHMAEFSNHKSMPNVFEFFEENNTAYIVMELLEGKNLKDFLLDLGGKSNTAFAVMVANEVGKALKSMHEKGIIHRDVAPDNIYICTNQVIKIKLMDFGAAKLADSTDEIIDIVLKPGYSPPEQYDNTKNIGPWTDIYALGATLYMMLTGVKPDESTNRKIKDTVVPVKSLNPTVSENLNNTIMKAIAVDKHMRFKTVDDFLLALNGEKKIIPLKKEKKRRKYIRFSSIVAAVLIISLCLSLSLSNFDKKRKEAGYLTESASIDVWMPISEKNSEPMKGMDIVQRKFCDMYRNQGVEISISLRSVNENEYEKLLSESIKNGSPPNLYMSTGVSSEIVNQSIDLNEVFGSETFKKCDILKNNYNRYYKSRKQIPLAVNVPVALSVTSGPVVSNYDNVLFSEYSDFSTAENIVVDSSCSLSENIASSTSFEKINMLNEDGFKNHSIILTDSLNMRAIDKKYSGRYQYNKVFKNGDGFEFIFEWSSFDSGNDAENKTAMVFLEALLSEDYQHNLCNDKIPVNKSALNKNEFKTLEDFYDYKMKG